jgi:acyl-CoA hydrolase
MNNKSKSPSESSFSSRKLVMPDQINPNGTLFGGVLMSWIDKVAFMSAQRHAERPYVVTVNIEGISFTRPIRIGDHVILRSQVSYVGRTSMEIRVQVDREDGCTGVREAATEAHMTFVALNSSGVPVEVPRLKPATREEALLFAEVRLRQRIRDRVRRRIESWRITMCENPKNLSNAA